MIISSISGKATIDENDMLRMPFFFNSILMRTDYYNNNNNNNNNNNGNNNNNNNNNKDNSSGERERSTMFKIGSHLRQKKLSGQADVIGPNTTVPKSRHPKGEYNNSFLF